MVISLYSDTINNWLQRYRFSLFAPNFLNFICLSITKCSILVPISYVFRNNSPLFLALYHKKLYLCRDKSIAYGTRIWKMVNGRCQIYTDGALACDFPGGYEFRRYYYSLYSFDVRNAWHRIVAGKEIK